MINYRNYPIILSLSVFIATFALTAIAMQLASGICWLPRIGGTLVGISVTIQGYMHSNMDRFRKHWRWGLTRDQAWAHFSFHLAIFGTFMWTFGDMIPGVLWLSNGTCLPKL